MLRTRRNAGITAGRSGSVGAAEGKGEGDEAARWGRLVSGARGAERVSAMLGQRAGEAGRAGVWRDVGQAEVRWSGPVAWGVRSGLGRILGLGC